MKRKPALKALILFFAVMALMTLISRAVETLFIANVSAEQPVRSAFVHEAESEGIVAARDIEVVWALPGLRVNRVPVSVGSRVSAGDILVEFDAEWIAALLTQAEHAHALLINERDQLELNEGMQAELRRLKLIALDMSIVEAKARVDTLTTLQSDGARICAGGDGAVTRVNIQAGEMTGDAAIIRLGYDKTGLTLTCTLPTNQASFLSVGDVAQVTPTGATAADGMRILSISRSDENGEAAIALELPDDGYYAGLICRIDFWTTTEGYRTVLPLSAMRKDSEGDYVLVLRTKLSVLGNTQVAERVSVTILDQDDTRAAVRGDVQSTDLVIIGWDKAVDAGDRIRLVSP